MKYTGTGFDNPYKSVANVNSCICGKSSKETTRINTIFWKRYSIGYAITVVLGILLFFIINWSDSTDDHAGAIFIYALYGLVTALLAFLTYYRMSIGHKFKCAVRWSTMVTFGKMASMPKEKK